MFTPRPNTPDVKLPDGATRITVKRVCGGCHEKIGDVTEAEMERAIAGLPPEDVRHECPRCRVCEWCKRPGHDADDHPLHPDHPGYDAFYDATDDRLSDLLSNATTPGGALLFPEGGQR